MNKIKAVEYSHRNWGPFVFFTKCPDYIVSKLLKEGRRPLDSYNHQLAGHLESQFVFKVETATWFYNEIGPILEAYREGHCNYHRLEKRPVEFQADSLWINFMKAGDFNPPHSHGSDYSFVLYLEIPEGLKKEQSQYKGTSFAPGAIAFEYGEQQIPRWTTFGMAHTPKVGDMIIFPALLRHWVAPFKTKGERVSVSGNLSITNKDTFTSNYF